MAKLPYNRICYIQIGGGKDFDDIIKSGVENIKWETIRGLDVKFDITHPIGSAESEANISICGLSFERIMQLMSWSGEATAYSRCWMIRVYAGYGYNDDDADIIFEGVILTAMPTMPPDIWLNIYARSHYANRYQFFTVDTSVFAGNTDRMVTVKEALQVLCKAINASDNLDGEDTDIDQSILNTTKVALPVFSEAATYYNIESAIAKICKTNNLTYVKRIQPSLLTAIDFAPYLYANDYVPKPRLKISAENGMIGIPKMRFEGIEVTSLLSNNEKDLRLDMFAVNSRFAMPGMFGQNVAVEDNRQNKGVFDAVYRCISIRYHGHLRGNEWFVTYNGTRFIVQGDKEKPKSMGTEG